MPQVPAQSKPVQHVVLGFLLWFIIDLGTAGGFRLSYLTAHGPMLLVFYLGYPLVFSYLIFRRQWSGRRLLLATAVAILFIEGVFTGNPFLLSFPLMLVGIPLAICIYAPLTYFLLWIVNHEVRRHRPHAIILSLVVVAVMFLTTLGEGL